MELNNTHIKPCSSCKYYIIRKYKTPLWSGEEDICNGPQCVDLISGDIKDRYCQSERYGYEKYPDSMDSSRYKYLIDTSCGKEGKYWASK